MNSPINGIVKILLLINDSQTVSLINQFLTSQYYIVERADDAKMGLEFALSGDFALVIFDCQNSPWEGLNFRQQLRQIPPSIPILFLVPQSSKTDALNFKELKGEADDYLTKPYDFSELFMRIERLLRRSVTPLTSNILRWENLWVDLTAAEVTYAGQAIALTAKEYNLLRLFLRHPQRIFSRREIIDRLWSMDTTPSESAVTNLIKDLRNKLKKGGMNQDLIESVYGMGYRLAKASNIQSVKENVAEYANNWQKTSNLKPKLSFPDGPVSCDSPLYIERPPVESLAYQAITQSGCVLRIRAPKQTGKSSLVLRLLAFAQQNKNATVKIDFNQIDSAYLTDLNKFLRCFCSQITQRLNIEPNLDEYWDEDIGSKLSCSYYLKNQVLKTLAQPLILILEEVDRLFEHPQLAQDFFPLLRSWYEEARRDADWQKLRLVVVYSSEVYISLDLNRSPFNVGLPLCLPYFSLEQVQELAQRYGLDWSSGEEAGKLFTLVGGQPLLIGLTLYYICSQSRSLDDILEEAWVNGGIYRSYLQQYWLTLQENPIIAQAYAKVVQAQSSIILEPIITYKLEGLGLIAYEGKGIIPRCKLYRIYFQKHLTELSDK